MPRPISPGAWTPYEMMRVRQVGDVQVSPDGLRVLYTVTAAAMGAPDAGRVPSRRQLVGADSASSPPRARYDTHIHLACVDGSDSHQLTFGEYSTIRPQWSPNGKWIAFVSGRDGSNDLYLLPVDGGDATRRTATASGIGNYKWSPDSARIAFVTQDPEDSTDGVPGSDARVIGAGTSMHHLWEVAADPTSGSTAAEARRLTQGNFNVDPHFAESFNWSPDGSTIAFAHSPTPQEGNRWPVLADISTVEVASGAVDRIVETDATSFGPVYSPGGEWLAYAHIERPTWPGVGDLFIVPAAGGASRRLHATFDRKPLPLGWSASGDRVYYTDTLRTHARVGALPADGGKPIDFGPQERVLSFAHLNHTRTHIGCVFEDLQSPPEAFVMELEPASAVSNVSAANASLPDHPLGHTELISWRSEEGPQIEGLLTYPVDYERGRAYPLIVDLHGGPHWFFSQVFVANPQPYQFPLAAFAASGYAVLRCNIRGSGGYGPEFRFAVMEDLGGVDFADVMAGVDHAIEIGVADPQRLGVLGWSYGAYLSAWAITQSQRFKAACMLAPVTNLISFTGTTDNHELFPGYLNSQFWDDPALFLARSPVMQVKGATTPALLLHGEADTRVPISQSFEFYHALRQQGCQTQMVAYPRMGHVPGEPGQLLDIMERTLAWYDRHL
jgi:dipeptidyl aminopeptidase/acylaminoacyl peptidase